MNQNDLHETPDRGCAIKDCPTKPTHLIEGEVGQWLVRFPLCAEHHRASEKGVPLNGLTIDTCQLIVEAIQTEAASLPHSSGIGPA